MKQLKEIIELANQHMHSQQYDKAVETLNDALNLTDEPLIKIDILNALGRLYLKMEKLDHAEQSFVQSIQLHESLEIVNPQLKQNAAVTYNNLGIIYLQKNPKEALKYHKKALKVFQEALEDNADEKILYTLFSAAEAASKAKNKFETKKHYKELIKLLSFKKNKNENLLALEAFSNYSLGNIFVDENNMHDANKHFVNAIKIYKNLLENGQENFRPLLASCYNNLAVTAKLMYRYDDAIKNYEKALEHYIVLQKQNPELFKPFYAETLNNLGIVWAEQEDVNDDYDSYGLSSFSGFGVLSAKNIFEQTTQESKIAKEDRIQKALEYFEKSLATYNELALNNPEAYAHYIATVIFNIANAYDNIQNYHKAEEYYLQAYKIRKSLAEKEPEIFGLDVAVTLMNLITLYQTLLEKELDLDYKEKALNFLKQVKQYIKPHIEKNPEKNVIKTMVSEIQYFHDFFENIDESYPEIRKKLREIQQLTDKRDETINLQEKISINENILQTLHNLQEKYPENETIRNELIKYYGDQSWIAARNQDFDRMKNAHDFLKKYTPDNKIVEINEAHYGLFTKTHEKAIETFRKIMEKQEDTVSFAKQLQEDFLILKNDGKVSQKTIDELIKWVSNHLS